MSWLRFVLCLVVVCGAVLSAAPAAAGDVESAVAHAEKELEHAADTDPGHRAGTPDPLSVDPDLAIWTLIVFAILVAVLGKFAWGPIVEGLNRREEMVANHIREAERNHEQARLLLAEYEKKLAGAAGDVRELLDEARRDAEHTKQEILVEAKAASEAEKARALRDIDQAADAAMKALHEKSVELAVELAGKIVQAQLTKADHARLIAEAMAKFPASTASSN
jgi:F-type H+-transporting ATPase subunit b